MQYNVFSDNNEDFDDGFGDGRMSQHSSCQSSVIQPDNFVEQPAFISGGNRDSSATSSSSQLPRDDGYARLLSTSYWSLQPQAVEMPWDSSQVFSNQATVDFFARFKRTTHGCLNVHTAPDILTNYDRVDQQVYTKAVRKLRDYEWRSMETANEVRAIGRWRNIIEYNFQASKLGKQLIEQMDNGASEQDIQDTISDTFGIKSWKTLMKRAGSILRYIEWVATDVSGLVPSGKLAMPPNELLAYQYLLHLRRSDASASAASGFVQALTFAKHTIGLLNVDNILESGRIRGAAVKMLAAKRPLVQSQPLDCKQLLALESAACHAPNVIDRVAAGTFCCILYARARFGDAQRTEKIVWDLDQSMTRGFIELQSRQVKTAGTAEKRSRFLPMTAPVKGISGLSWANAWMKSRIETELPMGELGGMPLLPAPALQGGWRRRPLTSSEAVAWMHELMRMYGVNYSPGVKVHSLKVTLLSWAAKRGLPPDVRKALGYHIDSNEMSMMTYSRDAMARPLRKLEALLAEVRLGTFDPDASRSGRLVPNVERAKDPQPDDVTAVNEAESDWYQVQNIPEESVVTDLVQPPDEEEVSESSSSSSESEPDIEERVIRTSIPNARKTPFPYKVSDCNIFQHVKYKTLHVMALSESSKFKCGRVLHKGYTKIKTELRFRWPKCGQCYFDIEADMSLPSED